jgi:hypothetical protein
LACVCRAFGGLLIIAVSNILGLLTAQLVSEDTDAYDKVDRWGNVLDKIGYLYALSILVFVGTLLATWQGLMLVWHQTPPAGGHAFDWWNAFWKILFDKTFF